MLTNRPRRSVVGLLVNLSQQITRLLWTPKFITVFTRARWVQFTSLASHPVSLRFIFTVPQLRHLIFGFLLRRSVFAPWSVPLGFMVDKVVLVSIAPLLRISRIAYHLGDGQRVRFRPSSSQTYSHPIPTIVTSTLILSSQSRLSLGFYVVSSHQVFWSEPWFH
jgi:hypothetical protein